jgi:hypothetical protein
MKYLPVVFLAASTAFAQAAPPQPAPPLPQLRLTLRQYHPGASQAPRRLSADERAELRRQIAETAKPVKRR